jgi:hypothetical protein
MTGSHDCDHRFLALLGNNGELDLALLNLKDRVRNRSLGENNLILPVLGYCFSLAHLGEKYFGIKRGFGFLPHGGIPCFFSQGLPFPPTKAGRGEGIIAIPLRKGNSTPGGVLPSHNTGSVPNPRLGNSEHPPKRVAAISRARRRSE